MDSMLAKNIQDVKEAYKTWIEAVEKFAKKPTPASQKKIRYYVLDLNAKKVRLTQRINDYRFIGGKYEKDQ